MIEECNKHGGVIHIYVDKKSAEVCITLIHVAILNVEFINCKTVSIRVTCM